ncbi:MAG: hypothetical protein LBT22_06425 [Peptococcaceae bacterium]|jgi:hypothetical protein|nr:hypothetical protein [Peptococcaceae bacterium]
MKLRRSLSIAAIMFTVCVVLAAVALRSAASASADEYLQNTAAERMVMAEEASGYFAQHLTQTSEVLLSFPGGVNYNEVKALCSNKFIDKFVAVGYNEVHRKE